MSIANTIPALGTAPRVSLSTLEWLRRRQVSAAPDDAEVWRKIFCALTAPASAMTEWRDMPRALKLAAVIVLGAQTEIDPSDREVKLWRLGFDRAAVQRLGSMPT